MENLTKTEGERMELDTQNGAVLVGNFFDSGSNKGIIMFPGITENRFSLYDFARRLNQDGFKVWAFDLNSQGESSGRWDIAQMQGSAHYIQRELKRKYGLKRIGGFGNSAGGMAMGIAASRNDSALECLCLTATPNSIKQVVPESLIKIASYVPQPLARAIARGFEKVQKSILKNDKYEIMPRSAFKSEEEYRACAQFGGLKIVNLKEAAKCALVAPKLSDHVKDIHQPTLLVYGGEDYAINGIQNSQLPENILNLYDSLGTRDKKLVVVPGASHALNSPPIKMGDCLNQDPKYSWVKDEVSGHFCEYML
jgi:alpha-beta hydrolase superfamily lysophospholipase